MDAVGGLTARQWRGEGAIGVEGAGHRQRAFLTRLPCEQCSHATCDIAWRVVCGFLYSYTYNRFDPERSSHTVPVTTLQILYCAFSAMCFVC